MKIKVLLSTQRSGSHFLKSFIESSFKNHRCTYEVLQEPTATVETLFTAGAAVGPQSQNFWRWYEKEVLAGKISVNPDQRMEAFYTYLQELLAAFSPRQMLVDIKYNSVHSLSGYWDTDSGSDDFCALLLRHEIPVLHLIRRNALRALISHKLAKSTGIFHRYQERSADEPLAKIRLDPASLVKEVNEIVQLRKDYQSRLSSVPGSAEIIYEDFLEELNSPEPGFNLQTLADFCGGSLDWPYAQNLPFKKTTPEDPVEVVVNWMEVVEAIGNTEHAWMLSRPTIVPVAAKKKQAYFFRGQAYQGKDVFYLRMPNGNEFGFYSYVPYPTIYHYGLGFLHVWNAGDGGVYFYDYTSGHFWYTSRAIYPNIYDYTRQAFLYYYPNAEGATRYFYDFAQNKVIWEL